MAEFDAAGTGLVYSTCLCGPNDAISSIAVDSSGSAYLTGETQSSDFPTVNPIQSGLAGQGNAFVSKISPGTPMPWASVNPTAFIFEPQDVGTTSPVKSVAFQSVGALPIQISSITVSGDFAVTSYCGTIVPSPIICDINVSFKPTGLGTRSGQITINDNAPGSPQVVTLTGTGIAPNVVLSRTALTFPSQTIGTTSPAQTITLSNTGSDTLTISSITTSGDFAQTNNCGYSVAVGSSCYINVTFTPTSGGTRTGTLTLTDNALDSPQTVTLSGTGAGPGASFTPTSLTFAGQAVGTTSPPMPVTLTNTGTDPLTITSIAITGANSGDFAQTNNCPANLAPQAACTINVTFTPGAAGPRTASVAITDNAAGSPQSLNLSGTGTAPAAGLAPPSLTFAGQVVGTTSAPQSVTLTNTGTAQLAINSLSITGGNAADFAQTNNCPASLAPQGSCAINVTFTPSATGTRGASITIFDNAPDSPQSVPLSGTGVQPAVSLSPTSLSFTAQYVGTTGLPQSVTVTNSGTAPLTISSVQTSSSFGQTNNCSNAIPVNMNCSIGVFFDPTASGAITGTLTITDNAPGSPHTVSLSGTGQDFNFGPVPGMPTSITVAAGQTASYELALSSGGGFNQTVTLACTGAPLYASCAASPGTTTINPSSPTGVGVAVATAASTIAAPRRWMPPNGGPGGLSLLLWLSALLISVAYGWMGQLSAADPARRDGARYRWAVGFLAVVMLLAPALLSCGGGSTTIVHNPGTPAGTYNLNVAATFSSGTTQITHNVQLTLTVH